MRYAAAGHVLLWLSLLPAIPAFAAEPSWPAANRALVDEHVIPRYQRLAEATVNLADRSRKFCAAPDKEGLNKLRDRFHGAMDAWMGVQHIRFGPVGLYLRYNRFQFWPDKHNTGARQLRRALAEQDGSRLTPEEFSDTSVALQGFTALERLLYGADVGAALFRTDAGSPSYHCRLVEAIAGNLAAMSRDIVREWTAGDPSYREIILGAEKGNRYFRSSSEVSSQFLNNLYTEIQLIVDYKLLAPLGADGAMTNARRAESWRSRRSLRNIKLNLQAAKSVYDIGFSSILASQGGEGTALDKEIRHGFSAALDASDAVDQSLYEAIESSSARPPAVQRLLEAVSNLKRQVGAELPLALNLSLGFNALDGD